MMMNFICGNFYLCFFFVIVDHSSSQRLQIVSSVDYMKKQKKTVVHYEIRFNLYMPNTKQVCISTTTKNRRQQKTIENVIWMLVVYNDDDDNN